MPTVGELPRTTASGDGYYNNSGRMYGGAAVPCVDGMQVRLASWHLLQIVHQNQQPVNVLKGHIMGL